MFANEKSVDRFNADIARMAGGEQISLFGLIFHVNEQVMVTEKGSRNAGELGRVVELLNMGKSRRITVETENGRNWYEIAAFPAPLRPCFAATIETKLVSSSVVVTEEAAAALASQGEISVFLKSFRTCEILGDFTLQTAGDSRPVSVHEAIRSRISKNLIPEIELLGGVFPMPEMPVLLHTEDQINEVERRRLPKAAVEFRETEEAVREREAYLWPSWMQNPRYFNEAAPVQENASRESRSDALSATSEYSTDDESTEEGSQDSERRFQNMVADLLHKFEQPMRQQQAIYSQYEPQRPLPRFLEPPPSAILSSRLESPQCEAVIVDLEPSSDQPSLLHLLTPPTAAIQDTEVISLSD